MKIQEKESLLIGDIYDAALQPALWAQVLENLCAQLDANSAIITALDRLNPDYNLAFTHNIPLEPLLAYREHQLDVIDMELNIQPMLAGAPDEVMYSHLSYGSQDEYIARAGRFYELCLKPSNIHYLSGLLLDHGHFRWSCLGLHRPENAQPFDQEQGQRLSRLGPHLRRALQIHRQLSRAQRQNTQLYDMLHDLNTGILLLDGQGRCQYANHLAENLLRDHSRLQLSLQAQLQAAAPSEQSRLQTLISTAIQCGRREMTPQAEVGGVIGLKGLLGRTPLMVTVTPLSGLSGYAQLSRDGIAAAVFLTDPQMRHRISRDLLQQNYGMTDRESQLCETFVNTPSLSDIAQVHAISLASVRTHFRNIYEKTEHRSQAELMRLLMGLTLDFEHKTYPSK